MSIFDKLKNAAASAIDKQEVTITFNNLPESVEEMKALPEASLDTPFKAAALTLCALCAYAADHEIGTAMLNFLRGPRPLSGADIQFLNARFLEGATYLPFSYFAGATPENDYTPSKPFKVTVYTDTYTYANEGYARLNIRSGGADSPRQVTLRKTADGKWMLWEQFLLVGIRKPKSQDPWA